MSGIDDISELRDSGSTDMPGQSVAARSQELMGASGEGDFQIISFEDIEPDIERVAREEVRSSIRFIQRNIESYRLLYEDEIYRLDENIGELQSGLEELDSNLREFSDLSIVYLLRPITMSFAILSAGATVFYLMQNSLLAIPLVLIFILFMAGVWKTMPIKSQSDD